jgi:hypothetical protein
MVQMQVMTITGKVVWTKIKSFQQRDFIKRDWDGKDDFGNKIGKEYMFTNQPSTNPNQ